MTVKLMTDLHSACPVCPVCPVCYTLQAALYSRVADLDVMFSFLIGSQGPTISNTSGEHVLFPSHWVCDRLFVHGFI